jgi:hypothetical protein
MIFKFTDMELKSKTASFVDVNALSRRYLISRKASNVGASEAFDATTGPVCIGHLTGGVQELS